MPWSKDDVDRHKKGLSDGQKDKWVTIANNVLNETGDEAEAIRTANSRTRKGTQK